MLTHPILCSDGVYEVFSTDTPGVSNHTLIAPIIGTFEPVHAKPSNIKIKRTLQGGNNVGCGNTDVGVSTTNSAVASIKTKCKGGPTGGGSVPGNKDFYSISGSVVVYFCIFSSMENHCYQDEIQNTLSNKINSACGSYRSCWDVIKDRAAQYGYEASATFCRRGT